MMFATIAASVAALLDPTAGTSRAPEPATTTAPAEKRRYCMVDTLTGTLFPKRECHTRAEWIERGVDPLSRK